MPSLPRAEVETELDHELAEQHSSGLTWVEERAAAACAMNVDDEALAEVLSVSIETVRGQRFRAAHKILDFTVAPRDRLHLGRWGMFHWDCCLVRAGERIMDGTWLET